MADLTPEALAARLDEGARVSLSAAYDADARAARNQANYHRGMVDGLTNGARLLGELAPAHAALAGQLRDALADLADAEALAANWPKCPDGCGCRLGTDDADASECGCDGPCTMECRENGYPDAPSYRDLAVSAERERIKSLFGTWIDIIDPAGEPNSHPPEAWKIAFAGLVSDKPQFTLPAREALEGGHG